jgi:hypothetical protein
MSGYDLPDITAASALIRHALAGRPLATGSEYGELFDRYLHHQAFRDLVASVADGLDLAVLQAPPTTGLVLSPNPDSPFRLRFADLRPWTPDERLVAGLVLLGIAALRFPREEDLDAEGIVRYVTVGSVEKFMREAIRPLAIAPTADAKSIEAYARSAAEAYERMPGLLRTEKRGQRKRGCTMRVIEDVFDLLIEQRMARRPARMDDDTLQLTDRFRVHVAEIAGSEALAVLRAVAAQQPAEG